jgi:hypothetical protein
MIIFNKEKKPFCLTIGWPSDCADEHNRVKYFTLGTQSNGHLIVPLQWKKTFSPNN